MRTIRITGRGALRVKPDTTRLTITLRGTEKEYGDCLRASGEDTEKLRDVLAGLGFPRGELKTRSFDVDTEYADFQDRDGVRRRRFTGYTFRHMLRLEFPSDNALLGKTLYALAHADVHPEFVISYTVRDPESVKNELLARAADDALAKAETLTRAARVRLKEIQSIDYSWGRVELEVRPLEALSCPITDGADASSYDLDIDPEDIAVEDTVTFVWEIE